MAAPTSLLWTRDPHTRAKHDMLSSYLDAWFPIMASSWRSTGATYAEGFAGPGEYTHGDLGSPILALQAAAREAAKHPTELRMIFVEERQDRLAHLKALVARLGLAGNGICVSYVGQPCETHLIPALDEAGAWGGPMFVNLDGWGVDTPYAIVERVGRASSSEVLITLETQWFTRFATMEHVTAGDIVFGETGWREVVSQDSRSKKRFLAERYLSRLNGAGFEFTLSFEMVDEGGNGLFLVFGTHKLIGVEKMKDAMWSIDKVSGQRFRDPRDLNQQTFEAIDSDPDLSLLVQQVLERVERGPQSLEDLKEFALRETMFKKAHADPAVRKLESLGKVERTRARKHEDVTVSLTAPKLFP